MKPCCVVLGLIFLWAVAVPPPPAAAAGKILYIDSYHQGYGWSDGILNGIREALEGTGVVFTVHHMDTKRHTDAEFILKSALRARDAVDRFRPDVVIASDDNASKYVIEPFFKGTSLPVVFCGVNWDASVYGFPAENVTGMVEVAPVTQLIGELERYADGPRLGFIGPDTATSLKEAANYRSVFGLQFITHFSKDAADWKAGFRRLQGAVDMMIIDSHGGLYADQEADLIRFVEAHTTIPTGTCYDFMADYALITFGKIPGEQGRWAARTALEILAGTPVSEIPVERNKEGALIINTRIAEVIGADIPVEDIEIADRILE
jgi:ABC-type uncharacterized transport system substrate-binding protein